MRDMSVSSSAHNGRAMIIFFSSSSFFLKTLPKCQTTDCSECSTKHQGPPCSHIIIAFNVARPAVAFKRGSNNVALSCGTDTNPSLSVCQGAAANTLACFNISSEYFSS